MKTHFEPNNSEDFWGSTYYIPGRWAAYVTHLIAVSITSFIAAIITLIVAFVVIFGGLWLAYLYLPVNIFTIILAVLAVDITLGIVVRALIKRRKNPGT